MDYLLKPAVLRECSNENDCFVFDQSGGDIIYNLDQADIRQYEYLIFDLVNKEDYSVCLNIKFWEDTAEKPCDLFVAIGILPGIRTTVCMPLEYINGQTLFGRRRPGLLKTVVKGNKINLEKLIALSVSLPANFKETALEIRNIRLSDTEAAPEPAERDLIDELGQYRLKDWPGKTQNPEENKRALNGLLREAEEFLSDYRNEYFGYKEKKFIATGFFRIEKEEDSRYWMVTPDGYGFFSSGVDCVGSNVSGPVAGEIKNYMEANLRYVFGDNWYDSWCKITKYRLMKWKINTIAAWSNPVFAKTAKIPYVNVLRDYPSTRDAVYRDFPDVFSPEYKENSIKYAMQLLPYKNDSYLIGYFMSNEPNWAFVDHLNLGYELIRNKKDLHSKGELIRYMKEMYHDSIEELNQAWQLALDGFDDLNYLGEFPVISAEGMSALEGFSERMVKEYIRVPATALKDADPSHMNLGIRYAYISSPALYSGKEYFDVFSINCYEKTCNAFVKQVFENADMPVMVGEFHFGAIDRGLPATGIRGAATQADRGKAIRRYIEEAAALDVCVGVHYFQYNDQPFLGRFDGENYNIGLVDICNKEYPEVVEQVTQANERLYRIADGKETSEDREIEYIPAIFY
jgi:hypothetical protein